MGLKPVASSATPADLIAPDAPDLFTGRLRGPALVVVRGAWVVTALAALGVLLAASPARLDQLLHNQGSGATDAAVYGRTLQVLGLSPEGYAAYIFVLNLLLPAGSLVVAGLLFWRKSDAWPPLLFGHLLIAVGIATSVVLPALGTTLPQAKTVIELIRLYGVLALFGFAYLFPDGRPVPRWVWLPMVLVLVVNVGAMLLPGTPLDWVTWPRALELGLLLLILLSLPWAQVARFRRTQSLEQRQQIKWILFGASTSLLVNALAAMLERALPAPLEPTVATVVFHLVELHLTTIASLLLPITVAFALLRYRLWDIDPLINRTLLYAALTLCVVGIYTMLVGYLSLLFQAQATSAISLAATVVIAIGLQPLRAWLQRGVDWLLYGERNEPYRVLSRLGQRLETTLAPDAALRTLVETVQDALKLPYVAVALGRGASREIVAAAGAAGEPLISLPLVYRAETVGELLVRPRAPREPLDAADRALLGEVARQAGAIAETVRLATELQRANAYLTATREQLVLTREEERRRMRRDLHDGLGPALAAQSLKVGAIRRLLRRDPDAAERLLGDLSGEIEQTIGDIRRLVYNLRPPALDELGLAEALRQFATAIGQGGSVRVTVDAPEHLPPLPAAVEVAAYRIVQEAVTNVVRHARADACAVALGVIDQGAAGAALTIDIRDDGVGLAPAQRSGVGLLGMRERAAELGGTCDIARLTPQGTGVWAYLPLQRAAAMENDAP